MQREIPNLPLSDRTNFSEKIDSRILDMIFQNSLISNNYSDKELALFLRINRQGLSEDIERKQSKLIDLEGDQKTKYLEISALTEKLSNINIDSREALRIKNKKDKLEKELYLFLPEEKLKLYSIKDISENLPVDSKLIEFQRYTELNIKRNFGIE